MTSFNKKINRECIRIYNSSTKNIPPYHFANLYKSEFGSLIIKMIGTLVIYYNDKFELVADLKDIKDSHSVKEIHMNNTIIDNSDVFKRFTRLRWLCGIPKITCRTLGNMFMNSKVQGDLTQWDVSKVQNMWSTFYNSTFQGDISMWDVSSVTNMSNMFNSSKFNGDISMWDTSEVSYMTAMFFKSKFNGDISQWNVSSVTDMRDMFKYSKFQGDISTWDTSADMSLIGDTEFDDYNSSDFSDF